MKIIARKRVYWFYFILALLFFFFYLLVMQSSPYQVNYSYSDAIMRKILNLPKGLKLTLLYFFIVATTSFAGYVISTIIKDEGYKKSFLLSFIVSFILSIMFFVISMLR